MKLNYKIRSAFKDSRNSKKSSKKIQKILDKIT